MRHPEIGKLPLTITGKHTTADTLTLFLGGMLVAGMVAIAGCGGGGSSAAADTTAPIFSSGASASFAENGTGTAYDATADNDIGVTYTLGGTDAVKFAINASSGAVTFVTSPDYEIPTDSGGNNVYDIVVTATDAAGNATNQAVAITVTNVVEAGQTDTTAPIFSSGASASFAENGIGTAYDATADNDIGVTYTLGGTDAVKFAINASSGAVTFVTSPDYEIPTDSGGNNVYDIVVTATDAAGNATNQAVAIAVTNVVEAGDAPTATLTAASIASNGNATVQSSEIGTAYLVKNTLAVSSLADITTAADNQWNSVAVTVANSDTVLSATGLQAGAYKLFTVNAIGRLSAAASNTVVVTNTIDANRIDLGAYGNLIAPVYVDGNWYFHWDRSGDGTSNDIGSLNGGLDYVARDVLDGIFANDINGVTNTTVINTDGNYGTTDTYRYATLNGIKVALPTTNGGTAYPNGINNYQPGTAIDNIPAGETNPAYDDLLAIWDAYNSIGTGTIIFGTPPGWKSGGYLSATPSWSGHAFVVLTTGYIYDYNDLVNDFVALQVL